jgi:biotin operon repressor
MPTGLRLSCPQCGEVMVLDQGKAPERILKVLQRDEGKIIPHDRLATDANCSMRSLSVYVSGLRTFGHIIQAVNGRGYRYLGKVKTDG